MTATSLGSPVSERVAALPWGELHDRLDVHGFAQTPALLSARECAQLASLYDSDAFRSTVTMGRHRFGEGEYKYFELPLPDLVAALRSAFYPPLARAANRWAGQLEEDVSYPDGLDAFLERTRTSTARSPPRSRSSPCSTARTRTSRAASSCCSSSARAHRAARTSAGCVAVPS